MSANPQLKSIANPELFEQLKPHLIPSKTGVRFDITGKKIWYPISDGINLWVSKSLTQYKAITFIIEIRDSYTDSGLKGYILRIYVWKDGKRKTVSERRISTVSFEDAVNKSIKRLQSVITKYDVTMEELKLKTF